MRLLIFFMWKNKIISYGMIFVGYLIWEIKKKNVFNHEIFTDGKTMEFNFSCGEKIKN